MGAPEPQLDPTLVSGSIEADEETGEASAVEDGEQEDDNPSWLQHGRHCARRSRIKLKL